MTARRDLALPSRSAANAAARAAEASSRLPVVIPTDALAELRPGPEPEVALRSSARPTRTQDRRGDEEFLPSTLLLADDPSSPVLKTTVLLLAAMLVAALAWSYFGRIASYATAAGKVQAVGRTKVLEAQQSGQVVAILKRDGDRVDAGDAVLKLDPADALAARSLILERRADLRGQNDRRGVEIRAARADPVPADPPVAWSDDVPKRVRDREAEVMRADLARLSDTLATLASRRAAAAADVGKYSGMIEAQKALVAVTAESSSMADTLQKRGWNSRAKALDLLQALREQQVSLTSFEGKLADAKADVATLDGEATKTRERFVSDDTDALTAAERQLSELDQELVKAERTVAQTTVRAPVGGVIHASAVTTLGQFVRPTEQLMQIVPENAPVEVVAFIDNADIGLVRVGQDASIKVDTFNSFTYGTVDGKVESVSGDALPTAGKNTVQSATLDGAYGQSTTAQKTGTLRFQTIVRAPDPWLRVDGRRVPLTPGMSVTVDIEIEKRRLIDYVVSPVLELLSTAAHER